MSLKPTLVTICYGMNDGRQPVEKFRAAMNGIVGELKAAGVRVALLTPGCVDPEHDKYGWLSKDPGTYNATLSRFAQEVLALGQRENVPVFNLHERMLEVQTRAKRDQPQFTMIPDGIHPDPPGHAIMTYGLLKALGAADAAASLSIDAASGKVTTGQCTIEHLKVSDQTIAFDRTDRALPTAFFSDVTPVLPYLSLVEEFNQYRFQVTGLKAPSWKLVVNGITTGTFSNAALATGVNLAMLPGPWRELARRVNDTVVNEQDAFFRRWVFLSHYPAPPELKPGLESLIATADRHVDRLQEERFRLVASPTTRTWTWTLTAVRPDH